MSDVSFKLAKIAPFYGTPMPPTDIGYWPVIIVAGNAVEHLKRILHVNEQLQRLAGNQCHLRDPRHSSQCVADLHRAVN